MDSSRLQFSIPSYIQSSIPPIPGYEKNKTEIMKLEESLSYA
jgi:hypothetical protein